MALAAWFPITAGILHPGRGTGIVAAGSTDVGGDEDFAIAPYHAVTEDTATETLPTATSPPDGPSQRIEA